MRRKKIVLYAPHFVLRHAQADASYRAVPPLSHLALAGPLREAGWDVRIIDAKWDLDWRRELRETIDEVACVGVSSLTGPAVRDGLDFSEYVKSLRSDLPVVWGGWHATFAAQQALEDPRIDLVVRGFGETTFVEVLQALQSGAPLDSIAGIHFRRGGAIVATPDRATEDISGFPAPAYDLVDVKRYIFQPRPGMRMANTIFSRGCPFACDFCLDSRNKWTGVSIDRMLHDIEFWIERGANVIRFYDGNFFLGRPRIVEFCNAILSRGLEQKFRWMATAVGNRVVQMDYELLALLKRAGVMQVAIGAESGSDELLSRITNKTTVAHTLESVRRLTQHGINQYLFFMVGYPDEPADALDRTLDLAYRAKKINPNVELFLNFTTPLPGSEVFRLAVERGEVEYPKTFEDWGRFDYNRPNLVNITPGYARAVSRFQQYLHLAFPTQNSALQYQPLVRAIATPLRTVARWRLRQRFYSMPIELKAFGAVVSAKRLWRRQRVATSH